MPLDTTRRTWRGGSGSALPLLAVAILLAACQGAPAPSGTSSQPGATASPGSASSLAPGSSPPSSAGVGAGIGDLAWIFDTTPRSVDLAITLDQARGAESLIPIEGGAVTATGADGTVFTLVIPDDALLVETTIGLTPVASLTGLPFGSDPTHAVQLSPDGLFLYAPAVLTITPPQPIPAGEQIPFGYLADGKDVVMAEPVLDAPGIAIQVSHFSGNGVTKGLLADIEPDRRRLGGDIERRLAGVVNEEFVRSKQNGGSPDFSNIEAVMLQYEEQVVKARIAAAGESCAKGKLAIQTVFGLGRQRALLGLEASAIGIEAPLVEKATRACVIEEFELCVEDHVVHRMAQVWNGYRREFALYREYGVQVGDGPLEEARELTIKCLTFELKFESTGSLDVPNGGYTSTVTSEVVLRFDADNLKLTGDAALVNEEFEFRAPCGATGVTGGGTFEVGSLMFLTAKADQFNDDELNLQMSFLPGATSESAKVKACPPASGTVTLPPSPLWTTIFLGTHIAELDSTGKFGGGYIAIDWEVFGSEYYAKKEWIKEASGGGGTYVEAGTFKLYHTPGA